MDLAKRNLIDLQQYINFLQENNHLVRVKSEVDSYLELAGIAKKYEGLDIEKIKKLNKLNSNKIMPGQKLIIG